MDQKEVLTVTKVSYNKKSRTKIVELRTKSGKKVLLRGLNADDYGSLIFEGIRRGQQYTVLPDSNLVIYSPEYSVGTISVGGRDAEYCGLRCI